MPTEVISIQILQLRLRSPILGVIDFYDLFQASEMFSVF